METLRLIAEARIIPTLKVTRSTDAPPLFAALCSGGITAALVTFVSDESADVLRQGSRLFPDLLLGADGICSTADADAALRSGARIISTNGFSAEINALCRENGLFYLPFCLSPSELLTHQMQNGKAAGLFSPEAFGGRPTVRAFADAFPRLPLVPSNIPLEKLSDYLAESNVIAVTCTEITEGSLDEVIDKCLSACSS